MIHKNWPVSMVSRLCAKSSSLEGFLLSRQIFALCLSSKFIDRDVLEAVHSCFPNKSEIQRHRTTHLNSWLVLPFSNALLFGVGGALKLVCPRWQEQPCHRDIIISWKNIGNIGNIGNS